MYDDGLVACTDHELIINRYYFPFGSAKRIRYSDIRGVSRVPLPNGSRRIWGSGDFTHWLNLDAHRPQKKAAFVIDLGKWVVPVITPDEPGRFAVELAAHGVTTSGNPPQGLTGFA
ncbi:hypothetical protein Pth03_36900 [Planotetraspora thailandica]|uniref:Uncharacterized protein n=1 Tax=Planotetraspora thailandica TaxID=487172 RepID=A0A8J3V231_9ACTN|nr:hypothetical protein [Planotetraspora thailandica]GII55301.1 hypothetical protein Pth03_36900 [Planotetraspora thailandica]